MVPILAADRWDSAAHDVFVRARLADDAAGDVGGAEPDAEGEPRLEEEGEEQEEEDGEDPSPPAGARSWLSLTLLLVFAFVLGAMLMSATRSGDGSRPPMSTTGLRRAIRS